MAGPRVAIKFCGGCDPAYERGEYFQAIRSAAGRRVQWVRPEEKGWGALLLLCGCATACPLEEMAPLEGRLLVCLTDDETPPEDVMARLMPGRQAPGGGDQD